MGRLSSPHRWRAAAAVAGAALLASVSGCVRKQAPADTRPEKLPKLTLDCIFIKSIDDWKVLDAYNLVIYAPARTAAYHLELVTYCRPLQFANRIGIASRLDGRLCAFGGDALLAGDQRCTIGAIRPYKTGGEF